MDALERSHLLHHLTGNVWLSQNEAFDAVIALADRDEGAGQTPDMWMARGLI
jgi:SulP family sulfate permease